MSKLFNKHIKECKFCGSKDLKKVNTQILTMPPYDIYKCKKCGKETTFRQELYEDGQN